MVRLSAVLVKIPPLPHGPLSVRTMRIDSSSSYSSYPHNPTNDTWVPVSSSDLVIENRSGWQRIELSDPVDVQYIRVVCLTNQASRFLNDNNEQQPFPDFNSVGYFTIRFE